MPPKRRVPTLILKWVLAVVIVGLVLNLASGWIAFTPPRTYGPEGPYQLAGHNARVVALLNDGRTLEARLPTENEPLG